MNSKAKFLSKIIGQDYVTFTFGSGTSITWKLGELSTEMIQKAAIFGLSKLGDDSVERLSFFNLYGNAHQILAEIINELREDRWPSALPAEDMGFNQMVEDLIFQLNELKKLNASEAKMAAKRAKVVSDCASALQILAKNADVLRNLVDGTTCSDVEN